MLILYIKIHAHLNLFAIGNAKNISYTPILYINPKRQILYANLLKSIYIKLKYKVN